MAASEPARMADTAADDLPLPRMHETTQGDDMSDNEREQRYAEATFTDYLIQRGDQWRDAARAAERALADERAKVARVEALMPPDLELIEAGYWVLASDLRAALAGPDTEATQ